MTTSVTRRAALIAILLAGSALEIPSAAAQQPKRESAEQIAQRMLAKEQIEQLLLDYGRSLDARDFATYSSLFAADGEWVGGFGTVKGPANIKIFMEKALPGKNTTNNYHLLSNFVVKVDGETATAWSRWAFVQPQERGAVIAQAGRYDDTLVKENGVWKFKKRTASNDTGRPAPAAAPASAQ
jgi:uncharacterized protein (TIGR02246 family)